MSKITFDIAIEHVLDKEGGYVNNPNDRGGETKFGISKKAYPGVNIALLTRDQAKAIYKRDYWDRIKADSLPDELRLTVFDMAINAGPKTALDLIGNEFGLAEYSQARRDYYWSITAKRPQNKEFVKGWLNRTNTIEAITKALLK